LRQDTGRDVTFEKAVDLPGAADTLRVGKDEHLQQHYRMELWPAKVFLGFLRGERLQPVLLVEVVDGVGDKSFETIFLGLFRETLRK
jgi:hypothetical protein